LLPLTDQTNKENSYKNRDRNMLKKTTDTQGNRKTDKQRDRQKKDKEPNDN